MKLRSYQQEAVDKTLALIKSKKCAPLIGLPTGTGKSLVLGDIVRRLSQWNLRGKILMLTHRSKLIEQNFRTLMAIAPTANAGINSAQLNRRDYHNQIIYCSIQSVAKKADKFGVVSAVIIDEAHLVSPKAETQYHSFISALTEVNPGLRVIGLTATPYRMGLGYLTEGGSIFDCFSYNATEAAQYRWFFEQGYLTPLVPRPPEHTQIDLSGVSKRGGEFIESELQKATDQEKITKSAVKEIVHFGQPRKKWLVFCTGIEHCGHIKDELDRYHVKSAVLHSKMTTQEKDHAFFEHKHGLVRCLINADMLTEGYDDPEIDLLACLRATESPGLWSQICGRATRTVYADNMPLDTASQRRAAIAAGPKPNALILDFARNTERLGTLDRLKIPTPPKPGKKRKKSAKPVAKVCLNCDAYVAPAVRKCPHCDYRFPLKIKLTGQAAVDQLIEDGAKVETVQVDGVSFAIHKKRGAPDSLKVMYQCGYQTYTEYLPFDNLRAQSLACKKWTEIAGKDFVPTTTEIAFNNAHRIKKPTTLQVRVDKKYPEILQRNYINTGD